MSRSYRPSDRVTFAVADEIAPRIWSHTWTQPKEPK